MASTKQDLRQIEAKTQDFENLGLKSGIGLDGIVEGIDTDLNLPLKLLANFPTANSKVFLSDSSVVSSDGANKTIPPIKRKVFSSLSNIWIDFQASGSDRVSDVFMLDITYWPQFSTTGSFRYACLTLTNNGKVRIDFSPESSSILGLEDPGAFFAKGGLPLGYLLLQATDNSSKFKTAGSISSIIENFGIYRFGSGGGTGQGADVIEFNIENNKFNPQEIEELVIDADESKAFKVEYSVRRTHDAEIIVGGEYDTSFSTVGARFDIDIRNVKQQADGKFLAVGTFNDYSTDATSRAVALNTLTGEVYQKFCQTAINLSRFNGDIYTIVEQPDGKILIGGNFTNYNQVPNLNYLVRLNSDYTIDTGFVNSAVINVSTSTARFNALVRKISLASDGSIYIAGNFTNYTATGRNYLAKVDSNGILDLTFMNNAVVNGTTPRISAANARASQYGSAIYIYGSFTNYNGVTGRNRLLKTNLLGELDTSFQVIAVDDNRFASECISAIVGRYSTNTDKLFVVGSFTLYSARKSNVVRLLDSGKIDHSFSTSGTGFNGTIYDSHTLSDFRVYVAGSFSSYNSVSRTGIARLTSNGSLDTSFSLAGAGFNSAVRSIVVSEQNSNILLCGEFTLNNLTTANRIIRLTQSGTVDSSFVYGTGFNNTALVAAAYAGNTYLIGGNFSTYNGTPVNRLVRLNNNGSIDGTFSVGVGFNGPVTTIHISSSGKIFVAGTFTQFNNLPANGLIRLNSDGTRDTSFDAGNITVNATVGAILEQEDEKIIIGAGVGVFSNAPNSKIVRLKKDGTLDTTFQANIQNEYDSAIRSIIKTTDNKLIAAGNIDKIPTEDDHGFVKLTIGSETSGTEIISAGSFRGLYRTSNSSWALFSFESSGDDSGIAFTIDNNGQVSYTSSNILGPQVEGVMRYRLDLI